MIAIILAYVIGMITGAGLRSDFSETIGQRIVWVVVMLLIGFGIYYLLTLIGIKVTETGN